MGKRYALAEEIKIPDGNGNQSNAEAEQVTVKPLLNIGIRSDGKIQLEGALQEKQMCVNALAEAIKVVMNLAPPSPLVKPAGSIIPHGILNFARRRH